MARVPLGRALRRTAHHWRLRALDAADLLLGRRNPLVPPRLLNDAIGGFDFLDVGRHLASIAIDHARLRPTDRILDLGCGAGRLAVPLTAYLTTGEYVGFDVSRKAIEWCDRAMGRSHPNFWFRHVDVANSHYNPRGRCSPEQFRFPCADASVDVVFAASLFTHLLPQAAEHYLAESARVLKQGGRAVFSFYLFNPAISARLATLWPCFQHFIEPYCAAADQNDPEAALAYDERAVLAALERNGFGLMRIAHGEWSHNPQPLSFQDFIFAQRTGP